MYVRTWLAAALFALTFAPAAAHGGSQLAPADEYFGRFRVSILGITNLIRDSGVRLDRGANPETVIDGSLAFAADGIRDWESKYPNDPWIAKDLVILARVYGRIPTAHGQDLAQRTVGWLEHDYPNSAAASYLESSR